MPSLTDDCMESVLDALVQGGEIADAYRDEFLGYLAERLEGREYKPFPPGLFQLLDYSSESDLEWELHIRGLLWCCISCERWCTKVTDERCLECKEAADAGTERSEHTHCSKAGL